MRSSIRVTIHVGSNDEPLRVDTIAMLIRVADGAREEISSENRGKL